MHKLESINSIPSALTVLTISSVGLSPSVRLSSEDARELVGEKWETSKSTRKQIVTFISSDGSPVSLEGNVPEDMAVEMAAAYKVTIECRVENNLKAAFDKGRVSRSYTELVVAVVKEVWSSSSQRVYPLQAEEKRPGSVMDPATGRVSKVA